jgi:hypothetical protein
MSFNSLSDIREGLMIALFLPAFALSLIGFLSRYL